MTGSALTHGWARLARAGVLGAASLLLATGAHTVGGGVLPGAGLLALLGVALALVAVSLTARRLRFGVLVAALIVEQLLLHYLLHAATTAASACAPLMSHHALRGNGFCAGASAPASGWSMPVAHLLAVVAMAWLLARGEQWLWRTVDRAHACATAAPTRVRRRRPVVLAARTVLRPGGIGVFAAGPRAPPLAAI